MKYGFHILLVSAFVISLIVIDNAYATGSLSFSQDKNIQEHSVLLYCNDCPNMPNPMTIDLNAPGSNKVKVNLWRQLNTNDYASSRFVKLCTTNCVPNYDFVLTSLPNTITMNYTGVNQATTEVFVGEASLPTPPYNVAAKSISPNNALNVCDNYGGDTDADKICDGWENNTDYPPECPETGLCVRTSASAKPYFLECNPNSTHWSDICPDPYKADVYFEFDYMKGHKPSDSTILAIATVFKNSNYYFLLNGQVVPGINFHAQLDEELPHVDTIPWQGTSSSPGFNQLKYWWFGTASERNYTLPDPEKLDGNWLNDNTSGNERSEKAQVFHYILFAHKLSGTGDPNSSGAAEKPGNDAIITLGAFDGMVGSEDQKQGILLHEIGHTLGLDHGGSDSLNCKPNYLSVMSYSIQFPTYVSDRRLDFSRSQLSTLIEGSLNENLGIQASIPPGQSNAYGPSTVLKTLTGTKVDWNRDGKFESGVNATISDLGINNCQPASENTLKGYRDWLSTNMILAPYGLTSNGSSEDEWEENSKIDDGMLENAVLNEITSDDVIQMHVQKIDNTISELEKIPNNEFVASNGNKNSIKKELEEVQDLIKQNVNGTFTMEKAYKKLDEIYLKLDGLGDDDVIKSDSKYKKSFKSLVADNIISQSHSLGGARDYANNARILNGTIQIKDARDQVIPIPNKIFDFKIKINDKDKQKLKDDHVILCKQGFQLFFRANNTAINANQPICLKPDSAVYKWEDRGVIPRNN